MFCALCFLLMKRTTFSPTHEAFVEVMEWGTRQTEIVLSYSQDEARNSIHFKDNFIHFKDNV